MEDRLQVGIVTTTHGLKGEVKVYPTTDDPKRFKRLKEVLLDTGKGVMQLEVESVRFFKQMVILKFKGYDTIDEVTAFRQKGLYVSRENAVRLRKDEYFIADLIGMRTVDEEGASVGTIRDVLVTGANDVYVIDMEDGRELLLPAIKQCVLDVDVEAGIVRIHILDGLLEL